MAIEANRTYWVRDPFAGAVRCEGRTLRAAVAQAYAAIPPEERPAYVWHQGQQVPVPGGLAVPVGDASWGRRA